MTIILTSNFKDRLNIIIDFIAKDSPERALAFRNQLFKKIKSLTFMPFRCRKNTVLNDQNVRDLIFKGYVIIFRIKQDEIEILEIFKENLPSLS